MKSEEKKADPQGGLGPEGRRGDEALGLLLCLGRPRRGVEGAGTWNCRWHRTKELQQKPALWSKDWGRGGPTHILTNMTETLQSTPMSAKAE